MIKEVTNLYPERSASLLSKWSTILEASMPIGMSIGGEERS
jgi:hypothetical protein